MTLTHEAVKQVETGFETTDSGWTQPIAQSPEARQAQRNIDARYADLTENTSPDTPPVYNPGDLPAGETHVDTTPTYNPDNLQPGHYDTEHVDGWDHPIQAATQQEVSPDAPPVYTPVESPAQEKDDQSTPEGWH